MTTAAEDDTATPAPEAAAAPAPAGPTADHGPTVAFLFVTGDPEGERLAELRTQVLSAGGRPLDPTVDSFPAAFPGPSAALDCGRAMLRGADDLRIAIHCGEPLTIEDGRYFGAAVWTAARLSAQARPGRILLSRAAADLIPGASRDFLRPAGTLRLRGLAEPVDVVEDHAAQPDAGAHVGSGVRVVTVLSIDQVGSTALIDGLGDTAARTVHAALMDVIREAVDEHRGAELEYGGDGLTIGFDSALSALDCATAVQRAAAAHRRRFPDAALVLRAVVVSGEADPRSPASVRPLLAAAAQLVKRAAADEVLVSPVAAGLAADRRDHVFTTTEDADALRLDWRSVVPDRALPPDLPEASVFVGREQELDRLLELWSDAEHGQQRVVLVDAPTGMGKSALAGRFARLVSERAGSGGATVLYGRAAEIEVRALEALSDALSDALTALSRADLRRLLGDRAPVLKALLPVVADRLPSTPAVEVLEPARVATWAKALSDLLDAMCEESPVLLVLDDLHLASADLVAAIRVLAERRTTRRLLLIGLHRSADAARTPIEAAIGDAAARGAFVARMALQGLDGDEAAELVAELADEPLDAEGRRTLAAGSDGRPRFVIEFALARVRSAARHDTHAELLDRSGAPDVAALAGRVLQLERLRPDDGVGAAARSIETDPYQGLAAFDGDSAARFFGRERMTAELVARVGTSPLSAVVGASGSGKSSLVRAGLLPALAHDVLPGSSGWSVLQMVPGPRPLDALAAAVAEHLHADPAAVRADLHHRTLPEVLAAGGPGQERLVLVVDQAEELFTSASAGERDRFAAMLEEAVTTPGMLSVVLVLRAEFYGAWAAYPGLAELLVRNHLLVRAMTDSELRRAVEAPAARAGLAVEPALVDVVVADVTGEPGSLPLLSTAMSATWQRRRGRRLTLRAYAETGGVRQAVARLADAAYDALPEEQRSTARALLLRLAQPGGPDAALDLRRRAPLDEVLGLGPDAAAVLHAFVDRRLLVADDATVEVAHEALLREWPLLRGWLDDDRDGRVLLQSLAVDARTWQEQDHDPSLLYRGGRLARATEYSAGTDGTLATTERAFLAASTAGASDELGRARRSALRLRRLAAGLVVVLVVALVGAGVAIAQGRAANDSATAARAAALTAQANALGASQEDLAGLLALAADRVHPTAAAAAAVVAAANRSPELQRVVALGGSGATTAAISTDGQAEAVIASGGRVDDFVLQSGRRLGGLVVHGAGAATPVAVSTGGRFLAVADSSGIRVLDTRSGHARAIMLSEPSALAFLANGTLADLDPTSGTPAYHDPATGDRVTRPAIAGQGTAAVTADGRTEVWTAESTFAAQNPLFQNYGTPRTRVVDVASGKQVGAPITGLLAGMSADGRRLAILQDPDLLVLDTASRRVLRKVDVGSSFGTYRIGLQLPGAAVAFDATGGTIAYVGADAGDPLHVIDVATGGQRTEPIPLSHAEQVPAFDGDGHLVAATPSGAAVFTLPTEAAARTDANGIPRQEYAPAPRAFVATDSSGTRTVEVIAPATTGGADRYRLTSATSPGSGPVLSADTGHRFDDATAAFSADGRMVAALEWSPGAANGTEIVVWDTTDGRRLASVGGLVTVPPAQEALPVSRIAFLGDSEFAAVTPSFPPDSTGQTTTVLDVWRVQEHPGAPIAHADLNYTSIAAFSADGSTLATLSQTVVNLWSTGSGHLRTTTPTTDTTIYSDLRFSADGSLLTAGASAEDVTRWDVAHPDTQRKVSLPGNALDHGWAVSPDGTTLAEVGPSSIEFRSFASGRVIGAAESSSSSDQILGFTRDGGAVVVWDGAHLELVDRSGDVAALGSPRAAPPTDVLDDDPDVVSTRSGVLTSVTSGKHVVVQGYVTRPSDAARRVCTIAGRDLTAAEWAHYLPGITPVALCSAS